MKNIQLILIFVGLINLNGCKNSRKNKINNLFFMEGNWSSSGTEMFENWKIINNQLEGQAIRIIDNKKVIIDSMTIIEDNNNNNIKLNLHLKYTSKKVAVYTYKKFKNIDVGIFVNDSIYPNHIQYYKRKNSDELIVKAGQNIIENEKVFEFLFVPNSNK